MSALISSRFAERAEMLASVVCAEADECDRLGHATPPMVEAMVRARIAEMTLPADLGGEAATLTECMEVHEAMAEADGSAGWVGVGATALPLFMRFLPVAQQASMYKSVGRIGAGSVTPAGRAEIVPGGYRVSGTWPFATGCHHSQWFYGNCLVFKDGERLTSDSGAPTIRFVFIPFSYAEILDTWQVAGMRATGSNHVKVESQFVPAERTAALDAPVATPGALFRLPGAAVGGSELGAVALGNARHALTEFHRIVRERRPMASTELIRTRTVVQVAAADAEVSHRAARLFLYDSVRKLREAVERNEILSMEQRALCRLAGVHAVTAAVRVADLAFHNAGSSSIYEGSHLERAWRDSHVIAQNVAGSTLTYEPAGRVLLGLEPESTSL